MTKNINALNCIGEQAASSTPDAWFGKTLPSKGTTPGPSPWANYQAGQSVARAESGSRKRPARELLEQGSMNNGDLPLVPDAVSQMLEERCKTLTAEMEMELTSTIQPVTSQVRSLAGALENTTRAIQEEIQGLYTPRSTRPRWLFKGTKKCLRRSWLAFSLHLSTL